MKIHHYIFLRELARGKDLLTKKELETVKDSFAECVLKTLHRSINGYIHLDDLVEEHEKLVQKVISERVNENE